MPWPRIRAAVAGERRPPPVLRPQLPDQVAPPPIYPFPATPTSPRRRARRETAMAARFPSAAGQGGCPMHERRRPRTRRRPDPLHAIPISPETCSKSGRPPNSTRRQRPRMTGNSWRRTLKSVWEVVVVFLGQQCKIFTRRQRPRMTGNSWRRTLKSVWEVVVVFLGQQCKIFTRRQRPRMTGNSWRRTLKSVWEVVVVFLGQQCKIL
ncbi:hypothetical protein ACQJBY_017070 [Aegilops geniculata]